MRTLPERTDTNNQLINQCYGKLQASRIVNVYRPLIEITGSFDAGVFLSQLTYWNRKGVDLSENNGFIFKTIEEIYEETGLTDYEQRHAKDTLKARELIETYRQKLFGKGSKTFIRLNNETILHKLCEYYDIDVKEVGEITPENWKIGNHPVLRRLYSDRFAYHRDLVYCLGNIESAAMLSYLLNRCAVEQKIYKSYTMEDWSRILCLSKTTQSTSRLILKELGVMEEQQLIPFNARIFSFPQFETILERLGRLSEYKENPVELPITKLAEAKRLAKKAKNGQTDCENNKSLGNNKLLLNCEIPKLGSANLDSEDSDKNAEKTNKSLKNNELLLNSEIPKLGTAERRKIEPLNCEILKQSFKENTLKDYSTYNNTPLNPPTISISFGGGGVVSSHSAISAENNSGYLNDEKSATETPQQGDKSPTTNANFDNLVYPSCFYRETRNDPQIQQAFKDDIRRIVACIIPFATTSEIQELLDETERPNVSSVRNYFARLCREKAQGLFFPRVAEKVKYHREECAKNIAQQQQTVQQQQANRVRQELQQQAHGVMQEYSDYIETMVFATKNKNELRQKLTDEYYEQAKIIENQLISAAAIPVIRIYVEKIATILIAYAYQFHETILDACQLRQKIVHKIGEKELQQSDNEILWNTLNIPEMQGNIE